MPTAPGPFRTDEAFARAMDAADPLRDLRARFHIPPASGGTPSVYMVGNSLGLQPRGVRAALEQELDDWATLGVEAHFHGERPWLPYHEEVRAGLARVVGALPHEVVAMNSLTANLHLLMVSFYRPTRERYKIVIEDAAFPSDSYAVQSQLDFHARAHGFDPAVGLIRLRPREGEHTLRTGDILAAIDREKASIALVMLGGVNYLTGQLFDIPAVTRVARAAGIAVGWDLAHAAGNIDLHLHDDGPDFAAWCSYKYLNSGPGAVAGAFVHERHTRNRATDSALGISAPAPLPRFTGWWGNDPATRFEMGPTFRPVASADAWQLSNPPVLALAPLRVSLELFDRATLPALRAKSLQLTAYLEYLVAPLDLSILTPREPTHRGCQLSLVLPGDARAAFDALKTHGVVADFRSPNVIRVAPVPLYNTFHDVWRLAAALARVTGARP